MKKLTLVLMFLLSLPVYSISNEKLTGSILSNNDLMTQVKLEIKSSFKDPQNVRMKFAYAGASLTSDSEFVATFYYNITVESDGWLGDISFGTCPMKFSGQIRGQSVRLDELVYDGCSE